MLSFNNRDWSLIATASEDLSRSKVIDLGRRFTSPYLIVRVSSRSQKDTWYFGGKIWATNLVLGQQAKFYQVDLDLFEQELLVVPKYFEGKYSLLYEAPKYFPDVTLKVWEYTGIVELTNNETNILDLLANQDILIRDLKSSLLTLQNSLSNLSIEIEIPETQLQQINSNTSFYATTVNNRINTLSNNLSQVLNNNANPSILQNSYDPTIVEDELI